MAIRIGITGGIGSGKSVVSRLLELMAVPVYVSDTETRQLMQSDLEIRRNLVGLLGEEVYAGGILNKSMLAAYLFASEQHAREINAIVHPRVKDDFRRWVQVHDKCSLVGIESAILIEAGFTSEVDKVVMVYAPREVRIARAVERDNSSPELIEQRIRRQMDDETKRRQADFVIINDGERPLLPQVQKLLLSL